MSDFVAGKRERRIGLLSACALVVANMVGAGVFTTSGYALADLGSREAVLLAWLVGGATAMLGALSYGALARRIPESGGEYTFLLRTVHPMAGFLAGWVSLLAGFTAPIAAAALALQAYLERSAGIAAGPKWIGILAIGVAATMHGVRLRQGVALQNAVVGLKLALIAGLVIVGWTRIPAPEASAARWVEIDPGAFAVTLVWISFAYSGWNAAVYLGGEVRNPQRNLPRSLWLATGIVAIAYVALNFVFLYSAPVTQLAGKAEVAAVAAAVIGGPALERAVSCLIALALFSSISSMLMTGPRVYAQMAEDGFLPRLFASGHDVPSAAVWSQAGLAVLVVWFSSLLELLGYIGFTLGLSAACTVAGLMRLRREEGAARVPVPGYPVVPALFLAVTAATSVYLLARQPVQGVFGILTAAVGVPLYWLARRKRARP